MASSTPSAFEMLITADKAVKLAKHLRSHCAEYSNGRISDDRIVCGLVNEMRINPAKGSALPDDERPLSFPEKIAEIRKSRAAMVPGARYNRPSPRALLNWEVDAKSKLADMFKAIKPAVNQLKTHASCKKVEVPYSNIVITADSLLREIEAILKADEIEQSALAKIAPAATHAAAVRASTPVAAFNISPRTR